MRGLFSFFFVFFFLGSVPRWDWDRSINWIDLDNLDQISIFTEAENLTSLVGEVSLASTTAEPKLNREWLFRSQSQDTKHWVPFQFQCAVEFCQWLLSDSHRKVERRRPFVYVMFGFSARTSSASRDASGEKPVSFQQASPLLLWLWQQTLNSQDMFLLTQLF